MQYVKSLPLATLILAAAPLPVRYFYVKEDITAVVQAARQPEVVQHYKRQEERGKILGSGDADLEEKLATVQQQLDNPHPAVQQYLGKRKELEAKMSAFDSAALGYFLLLMGALSPFLYRVGTRTK